jgi:hypothetical protein
MNAYYTWKSEEQTGELHWMNVLHIAIRERMQQLRGTHMLFEQGIVDLAVKE